MLPPDEEIETFIALRKEFPRHRIRLWEPNSRMWTITTAIDVEPRLHDYNLEYLEDPVWVLRAMQRVNARAPWVTLSSNMLVFAFKYKAPQVMYNVLDVVLLSDPHWYGGIRRAKLAGQICEAMGVDEGMRGGTEFGISPAAVLHSRQACRIWCWPQTRITTI